MRALVILTAACVAAVWLGTLRTSAEQAFSGDADYQVFCSSCHGATAKGDGLIAKSLPKRPPDLTRLAGRNNSVFPADRVFKTIEGRGPGSHTSADMPVWSDVFEKAQESKGPDAAKARIAALVDYLKSIQETR
jgi:hypothetical protein